MHSISKTKELVLDGRKHQPVCIPVIVDNERVGTPAPQSLFRSLKEFLASNLSVGLTVLCVSDKVCLMKVVKTASKIIGFPQYLLVTCKQSL